MRVQHPNEGVENRSRRIAAVILALGLVVGVWRPCAGGEVTADARLSCCSRNAMCPMRKAHGHGHGHGVAMTVSQAEADACCASADRPPSAPAPVTVVAAPPLVPVLGLFAAPPAVVPVTLADWHGPPPLLAHRQLPRHLLLSVFLI